jgi:peptidyl-dipeptidase A
MSGSMTMTKHLVVAAVLTAAVVAPRGYAANAKENALKEFIAKHVEKIKPLEKQANLAWWEAAVTGDPNAYDRSSELTLQIRKVYSDAKDFAYLRELKDSGQIKDKLLARQLTVLYNSYLANQIEPELLKQIVELGTEIEKNFSTFRAAIDGRKVTDNEIKQILKSETDSAKRQQAWLASKQVGEAVAGDIVRLVKLRNQAARKLGFNNYHTMALATGEQDVKDLDKIFAELYRLTNEPFGKVKTELDAILARQSGVSPEKLMPWHYHDPFFQETPMVYDLDLDVYYQGRNIEQLAAKFYQGLGLPVEQILANSDLYEKEGKNPHAFCTHIDREGDVRILCNIQSNEPGWRRPSTRLGHGVYDKYLDFDSSYPAPLAGAPVHDRSDRDALRTPEPQPRLDAGDARPLRRAAGRDRDRQRPSTCSSSSSSSPAGHMVMYTSRRPSTPIPTRTSTSSGGIWSRSTSS